DASPARSTAGSARSWSDPAPAYRGRGPRSCARPASPRRARRSRARSRALRSTRPGASGSTGPAADSVGPSRGRRTADTPPLRTGRTRPRRGWRSAWRRTDGPARPATRWSAPTSASVRSCVCPSPWAALYGHPVAAGEGFLMAFTTGCYDIEGLLKLLDEKHVWETDTLPAPVVGRDGYRQAMQMYITAFPDLHFRIDQMLPSGDYVVTRSTPTGTHNGELMGIPPTR